MKEKDIERRVCKYAREEYNMLTLKFVSPNNAGMPDRIFITKRGRVAFVEFKAPGGKLTPLQRRKLEDLQVRGCRVCVVDDVSRGCDLVDSLEWQP